MLVGVPCSITTKLDPLLKAEGWGGPILDVGRRSRHSTLNRRFECTP
jgi:hypothetical protein